MGKKLAIVGHPTHGKEVIELLEMLGGKNKWLYDGSDGFVYFIEKNDKYITYCGKECIKNTGEYIIYELEEFLEKFPYKVGDIVKTGKDEEGVIKQMRWVNNDIVYWVNSHKTCDWTQTLSVDVLDKYNRVNSNDVDVKVESTGFMQVCKTAGIIFNDTNYADEVELNLGDYEIEVRDGRTFAVKKKSKYPTTYGECCRVLSISDGEFMFTGLSDDEYNLFDSFVVLKRCRDAYWKMAGEQMGLGKSWEPDWNWCEYKFCIGTIYDEIERFHAGSQNCMLSFPTEEMRDAFYENFKDLIEQCKELL